MRHHPVVAADRSVYCSRCGSTVPYGGTLQHFLTWLEACEGDLVMQMVEEATRPSGSLPILPPKTDEPPADEKPSRTRQKVTKRASQRPSKKARE